MMNSSQDTNPLLEMAFTMAGITKGEVEIREFITHYFTNMPFAPKGAIFSLSEKEKFQQNLKGEEFALQMMDAIPKDISDEELKYITTRFAAFAKAIFVIFRRTAKMNIDNSDELVAISKYLKEYYEEKKFIHGEHTAFDAAITTLDGIIDDAKARMVFEPKIKTQQSNIYFQLSLTVAQKKTLLRELKEQGYTMHPQKLIDFLNGNNDVSVEIKSKKLHHISYLIYQLYNAKPKVLKLNYGKGYFTHFEQHISPFLKSGEKGKMKDLKRQVLSKASKTAHVKGEVDALIAKVGLA